MKRLQLAFFLLLTGFAHGAAASLPQPTAPKDTIVIRLPNQAVITLMVRDAAQLRQLKQYQLDSLTSRLATYINQAESAAKAASSNQVTMEFYPDKDQPGKQLPEQIRITTHKSSAGTVSTSKMEAFMQKNAGVTLKIGGKSEDERKARQLSRDSSRLKNFESSRTRNNLVFDLGLNAFANQKPYYTAGPGPQAENLDLRTEGSRYINLGLNWNARLGGKHSPLHLTVGPEFSFYNFMLSGNNKWVNTNGRTDVVHETSGRQFQKSKLATSTITVPLSLRLQLHDSHYRSTFVLSAGGFVGYRIKSWTKLKYTNEGTTYKDKEDGSYNMENLLYGLQATIGYRDLEFFGKYNLNPLFKAGAGPEMQAVSFGVRIFGAN